MINIIRSMVVLLVVMFFSDAECMESSMIQSPDAKISVNVWLTGDGAA